MTRAYTKVPPIVQHEEFHITLSTRQGVTFVCIGNKKGYGIRLQLERIDSLMQALVELKEKTQLKDIAPGDCTLTALSYTKTAPKMATEA